MYKAENILQMSKGISVTGAKGEHSVQDRLVSIQSRQSPQALALYLLATEISEPRASYRQHRAGGLDVSRSETAMRTLPL